MAGPSRFVAGPKNNKSYAKRGARADSCPGPRTQVNAKSMEDISEKKLSGQKCVADLDILIIGVEYHEDRGDILLHVFHH